VNQSAAALAETQGTPTHAPGGLALSPIQQVFTPALPTLGEDTFQKFRALIYLKTGIHMREGKQILVSNRLRKRLVELNLPSYEEYYDLLTSGTGARVEMQRFIDAVSTNETYFFREGNHFTALERVILPELFRTRDLVRIWSAGCSTGEEVYTLLMVADRVCQGGSGSRTRGGRAVQIIGTDISTTVIARARAGVYGERALRLVPPDALAQYFEPAAGSTATGAAGVGRVVREDARARVDFRVHNLFTDEPPADAVDVIFCRNVMIYFDKPTQARLVDGIFARAIHPDGYLFIGHSESLGGFSKSFQYAAELKAPIYRRKKEIAS
jgi:chemotaxis protein methyltransferase CheR